MVESLFMKAAYGIICGVIILGLLGLSHGMYSRKNEYRVSIIIPVIFGIYTIITYILFICAKSWTQSYILESLYFIGTDWLAFTMMLFSIKYTGISKKEFNFFNAAGFILCAIDSISLALNSVYKHMFILVLKVSPILKFTYLGNNFLWPHYIHLGLCYVMVGLSFIWFAVSLIRAPYYYKAKYSGIFITYIVVIIANFVSYSLNLPLDLSVALYGLLAGLISYFSTYTYPVRIVTDALRTVNENITDALLYYDLYGNCLYANKTAEKIFTKNNAFSPESASLYREAWVTTHPEREDGVIISQDTFEIDGLARRFEIEYREVYSDSKHENAIGATLKLVDKTEEINHFSREHFIATHDELTKIYNRSGFFEAVDNSIKNDDTKNRIMIISNIMNFKLINEHYGEKLGDEILTKQADLLTQYSHKDNIYGRINDDKFALYTYERHFSEERMNEYIHAMQDIMNEYGYNLHVHVGICRDINKEDSAQTIYDKALMALEEIRDNYNEVYSYYNSSIMEKNQTEKFIITNYEKAIEKKEFQMYLQPIVNEKKEMIGAEALVRWCHPEKGVLLPSYFLETMEKYGVIYQLDAYVWESAAKKIQEWQEKGINDKFISVNVSVKDFYHTDIYKTFTRLVENYDINPSSLRVEISESILTSDFEKALKLTEKLRKAGFLVAIDHFGNGYSSLNMLKDININVLKTDIIFLKKEGDYKRNRIILDSVIEMAKGLGVLVIPEGVELENQFNGLKKLGVTMFQGNYFSLPLPVEELEKKWM